MVRIVDFAERTNSEGEKFFALILQGGIELVKSHESGNIYATAKRTSITSTFDEATCKSLIGQELPGSIQKVKCDPYEYISPETGEILQLDHRWQYSKEAETVEEAVFEGEVVTA